MNDKYTFAELPVHSLEEIKQLESKLNTELGGITLIAYTKESEPDANSCRANENGE